MKTKEFIKKYHLNSTDRVNVKEFLNDLTHEFIGLLEYNKARDNIKGFENAVRGVKQKYDAINNKTAGNLGLWNQFYATKVVKLREAYCRKEMEFRRKKKKEKEEERKQRQEWYNRFNKQQRGFDFFDFILASMILKANRKPLKEMELLGITEDNFTVEDVKNAYREKSMIHHPDKGGKQKSFIEITKAKNVLLSHLT